MAEPKLIVTVCTANICRSPMAEALLRHALAAEAEPLKSARILSAGVAGRGGDPISENSRIALKKVGIELKDHRSRALTTELINQADAIFCMTESHRAVIQLSFDRPPRNIYLMREFMPREADKEIGDPYGSDLRHYEACRDEMVEAIPSILAFLRKEWGVTKS